MNFQRNTTPVNKNSRGYLLNQYENARKDLLLICVLTIVNLVLFYAGANLYFLFSISFSYYLPFFGMGLDEALGTGSVLTTFSTVVGVIVLVVFGLCWYFSKKHRGWMIASTVLFSLDTLFLLAFMLLSGDLFAFLFDIVIHACLLGIMISGLIAGIKAAKLPEEEPIEAQPIEAQPFAKIQPTEEQPAEEKNVWDDLQPNEDQNKPEE